MEPSQQAQDGSIISVTFKEVWVEKIVQKLKGYATQCTSGKCKSVVGKDFVMQSESVASSLSLVFCLFSILYFTLHTSDFTLLYTLVPFLLLDII